MIFLLLFCAFTFTVAVDPKLRVHDGFISINDNVDTNLPSVSTYIVNEMYTFEVFLEETLQNDYMIKECTMNGNTFITSHGCVNCGKCVFDSIETESYNKLGAVKRTLVHFRAQTTTIQFACKVTKIVCSGCAERSCQRGDLIDQALLRNHFIYSDMDLLYPAYATVPAHFPPYGSHGNGVWPWWLWLLLLLLLLLLLCCLLALCLLAFLRRRRRKTTTTTTVCVDKGKESQCVGTDKVAVNCVGTGTEDIYKCQPAVVVGGEAANEHSSERTTHYEKSRSRSRQECRDYEYRGRRDEDERYRHGESGIAGGGGGGGSYSVVEGCVREGYTRTIPYPSTPCVHDSRREERCFENQRNGTRDERGFWSDRSSYRNFAFERDMGRVEPLDGFDEVETREKTYCLSDDEQEIVEKDIKRTHTTRFVQETREYESASDEERFREEDHQHVSYVHSLPV